MKIYYRIINTDKKEGSLTVRYFTDTISEDSLATGFDIDGDIVRDSNGYPISCRTDYNISLYNNFEPTEDDFKKIIENSAPTAWFDLKEKILIKGEYSFGNIATLLGKTNHFEANTQIYSI